MSVIIKPPNREQNVSFLNKLDDEETCVNPGDVITENTDFMRGHGTYQVLPLIFYLFFDSFRLHRTNYEHQ